MRAVFRHELSSYFTGVTGYVFSAFLLLFTGIYTMVYNLQSASVHFEYVLGSMSFVFLIIVPILTMRVLAEERRQKTDQLLYSLPLTMTQVVLGKFAAMLVVFAAPMAVICLYPVVLSAYGNVYLPAAYGAIVGFFFLGMALLAIGMYISSVTESQAVAAGLCFVVMLVNYFLSDLAGFASSTAYSSLAALALTALIACGIVYLMTKNGFVSLLLAAGLEALGLTVIPSRTNFLLFFSPRALGEPLLERGLQIRDCANYPGLGPGWYRTAVRLPEQNKRLLDAIKEVVNG